jgi:N-acetylneuraminic acid mutarotase
VNVDHGPRNASQSLSSMRRRSMTSRSSQNLAFAFSVFVLVSCSENTTPTQPETAGNQPANPSELTIAANSWTAKARMPTARFNLAAGAVNNSLGQPILYAIGGIGVTFPDPTALSTVEAFNLATNTWSTKAPLPIPMESSNGVGVIGGKLYISGPAFGGGNVAGHLYMYDPGTNTWTRKADLPRPAGAGMTGVIDGKLYVLAGFTFTCDHCGENDPNLYRYDPVSDTWASLPDCPGQHLLGAGAVVNGKFYVAGGGEGFRLSRRLHVYDPVSNTWSEKARMSRRRYNIAGVTLLGRFYVLGGTTGDVDGIKFVEAYDPGTNTWVTKAPMLSGRSALAAARMNLDGVSRIVAVGGRNSNAGPLRTAEAYTP